MLVYIKYAPGDYCAAEVYIEAAEITIFKKEGKIEEVVVPALGRPALTRGAVDRVQLFSPEGKLLREVDWAKQEVSRDTKGD